MDRFQPLPARREHLGPHARFPRHRHREGYVTITLSGEYDEAGEGGRRRVMAGDMVMHGEFDAHTNQLRARTELFSMELPAGFVIQHAHGTVPDPDAIVVAAERDPVEALAMICVGCQPARPTVEDWQDRLAADIVSGAATSLQRWAEENNLHPASLARGFRQLFGVSPRRYRSELRSRIAWEQIARTAIPMATLAHDIGFADQAHMSRCVRALTGQPPAHWRRFKPFKT